MDRAIANAVAHSIPRYNDYLLRGFMAEQIAAATDFVGVVFNEAVKLFNGAITYKGYRILPPEVRADKELERNNGGCRIPISEMILVEYIFNYEAVEYTTLQYIPYLKNDVITIDDTTYVLQRSIKEQVASRTTNGITMKVIRQPIPFYYTASYRLESVSDDWSYSEIVPTTSIYQDRKSSRRKMIDATIIHYLLCKFGFIDTLLRFGLTTEDCAFVTVMEGDVETFRYFPAKKVRNKRVKIDLFLKVRKDKLENPLIIRLIASILYTVAAFQKHQVEHLYETSGSVFRIMLGRIINGAGVNEIQIKSKVDTHIASLDTYLDPITRTRLLEYGIEVNDIYDLLQYVFTEINEIIRNTSHTNLYFSRIDYLEELLVATIVNSIYSKWYRAETDPKKLNPAAVRDILKFPRELISKLHVSRVVQKNPPAYGDNAMVGWLIQKIRQSGVSPSGRIIRSPDHRFHPSMAVVESLIAFSKSNPGAGGSINPYLQITRNGSVVRPDYADDIDPLLAYLPYQ